ncbi:VRR-NUC domain-containing protein [Chloroflexota bacterium]
MSGSKFRTAWYPKKEYGTLPPEMEAVLESIYAAAGQRSGCPDVFVWKGDEFRFLECKQTKKDYIKPNQKDWLKAALGLGYPMHRFVVVEWDFA